MDRKSVMREKAVIDLRNYVNQLRSNSPVKMAPEGELAKQLQISNPTLQLAVKMLANEGLLVLVEGKGTYITPIVEVPLIHLISSPDLKNDAPYYAKFLQELTLTATKQNMKILMLEPEQIYEAQGDIPLIIVGLMENKELINKLMDSYQKIIAIQDCNAYTSKISQIHFHDYKIGYQAAQLLAQYNHKKVVLLKALASYAALRTEGFMEAAKVLGLEVLVYSEQADWSGGYHAGDDILKELQKEQKPTAVFAMNDLIALGLMQKLKENGIIIPNDISVLGCGDFPMAVEFTPTLTTFNLDMKYLTMELFTLINKLSLTKQDMTQKVLLSATPIIRETLSKLL